MELRAGMPRREAFVTLDPTRPPRAPLRFHEAPPHVQGSDHEPAGGSDDGPATGLTPGLEWPDRGGRFELDCPALGGYGENVVAMFPGNLGISKSPDRYGSGATRLEAELSIQRGEETDA